MKNTNLHLSEKEEQVMLTLWNSDKPLSAMDIANEIDTPWAKNSIQNLIKKLYKLKLIEIDHIAKICKTYGRYFKPTISREEYAKMQLQRVYKDDDISLILKLIEKKETSPDFSDELKSLLDKED